MTALALAAGCAPRLATPPDLGVESRRQRFERALDARTGRTAAELQLSAWAKGEWLPQLPGVQARLLLDGPDAFRLKVASMFGTALDVAARGDRFTAYVPARRAVLETGTARESLGLGDPGPLGCLVWSAGWRPPASAWANAVTEDSLVVVEWSERGEQRRLGVGASGLPAWIEWTSAPSDRLLRARYTAWRTWDGVWWPARMSVADGADTVELTARVDQIRFRDRIPADQMTIDVPDDAERVTRDDLRELLERMAGL